MMVTTGARRTRSAVSSASIDILRAFLFVSDFVGGSTEFARQIFGQFDVEGLVNGGEDLLFEQLLDDEIGFDAELFGEFFDGDAFGDGDFAVNGRRFGAWLAFGTTLAEISFFVFLLAPRGAAGHRA